MYNIAYIVYNITYIYIYSIGYIQYAAYLKISLVELTIHNAFLGFDDVIVNVVFKRNSFSVIVSA